MMNNEQNNRQETVTAEKKMTPREESWDAFKRVFRFEPFKAGRFVTIHSKFNSKCNIPGCNHRILKGDKIRHSYFEEGTGAICMSHQPQEQAYYAFVQRGVSMVKLAQEKKQQEVMNMMTTTPAASVASAVLYTDGAFRDGVYTWAYVLQIGGKTYEASGSGSDTEAAKMRNIDGELSAAMRGLSQAKKLGAKQVQLHHDYTGIADWVSGAWKAKNEHTQKYVAFVKALGLEIEFVKVKGHTGVALNERCDELCTRELNKAC